MIDPQVLVRAAALYGLRVYKFRYRQSANGTIDYVLVRGKMPEHIGTYRDSGIRAKYVYERDDIEIAIEFMKGLAAGNYGWTSFDELDVAAKEIEL